MTITSNKDGNGDTFWYILAWDTATGKSSLYYGSPKIKDTKLGPGLYQLPSNPVR